MKDKSLDQLLYETETERDALLAERDKLRDLLGKANALARIRAERIAELEPDASRYQFIRAGNVYVEPNGDVIYMAIESGKYYKDLNDMDMDLDEAIAAPKPGEEDE